MAKKKLQIFVSSTYLDLIDEREAAVEGILSSKHIPAGMELFRAGNTSQWDTIKRWIDESDIYMLILGGRYGSVETKSGKSYTQLEYEYAIKQNKPMFSVILSDRLLHEKAGNTKEEIFEVKNEENYKKFKTIVMSKMIKPVDDCKDIKLAIKDSISELEELCDLVGWIRSNEGDTGQLLQQLNESRIECSKLRNELDESKKQLATNRISETLSSGEEKTKIEYMGSVLDGNKKNSVEFTWNEIFVLLGKIIFKDGTIIQSEIKSQIESEIGKKIGSILINVLDDDIIRIQVQLEKLNLIEISKGYTGQVCKFTSHGREEFYNQLLEKKQ